MSMKVIKKTLKKGKPDEFENGTVIRWTSGGQYTYAALKTPAGWFTTARDLPGAHVPQVVSFERLLQILQRSETSKVAVAVAWIDPLTGDDTE